MPLPPFRLCHRFRDVGHSATAKKTLEKHRIGVLNAEEAAAVALKESEASAGGSSTALIVAAIVALAAALYYQFVYKPSQAV